MLKKYGLPVGIALAGIISVMVLISAKPTPEPSPAAEEPAHVKVAVTHAKKQTLRLSVTAHGNVVPKREIDIIAQVSGRVVSVAPAFVDGGFFTHSQVLLQIDNRDYRIALLNAKARLAEAAQRLAEEEGRSRVAAREWRDLGDPKANDLFMRRPQLAAAKANLASAQGDVDMAELNLERTRIAVPFDGRIRQTYADLGQYVTAGTRIATVYDSSVVEVRLPLTEKQAALIDLPLTPASRSATTDGGASVSGEGPSVIITGSVAGETHQWTGVLARTDAFVDADSRMYYAVVEVHDPFNSKAPGPGGKQAPLLPGLFVEAEITGKEIDNVAVLPRSALFQQNTIVTLDKDNKVVHEVVKVLQKSDSHVWVQTALADDILISTEKQSLTPEGTVIEPLLNQGPDTAVADSAVATKAEK